MGFTSFIKKLIEGNPEERRLRKEVDEEIKEEETAAYKESYKEARLEAAKARGKRRAEQYVKNHGGGGGSGGGFLDTLAKVGAGMNKASASLVKGIDIHPEGAGDNSLLSPDEYEAEKKRKRRSRTFDVPDPFGI